MLGLHVGFIDTDLTKDLDVPKVTSAAVAETTCANLEQDAHQVLADDVTRQVDLLVQELPKMLQIRASWAE